VSILGSPSQPSKLGYVIITVVVLAAYALLFVAVAVLGSALGAH